jgi:peptide/nickel transport system substrate-binding protein
MWNVSIDAPQESAMSSSQFDRLMTAAQRGLVTRREVLEAGLKFGLSSAAIMSLMAVAPEASASTPSMNSLRDVGRHQDDTLDTGTFTMLRDGGAPDLDPHSQYDNAAQAIVLGSHEMLIRFKGQSTFEYEPMLAESWEVSEDQSTYTFKLPAGVTFQDGDTCDATAVKASFNRFLLMDKGPVNVIKRFAPDPEMVEVVDDLTVRFNLGAPQPLFLSAMAASYGPMIVNTAYVEANKTDDDPYANEFYRNGAPGSGTGPYILTENSVNEQVVLDKWDGFHGGWEKPHFSQLVVRIVEEMSTRRQLVENGEADATVQNLSPEDYEALRQNADVQVVSHPSTAVYWTTINAVRTGSPEARQGLCWAFPYDEVVNGVYKGHVTPTGPLATTVRGYDPNVFIYTTDLDKAKELLTGAGFEEGYTFDYAINAGEAIERSVAELYQANLAEIGYTLDIQELDRATFVDLAYGDSAGEDRPFFFGGWGWWPDYNDAWNQLVPSFGSPEQGGFANAGLWQNERFWQILDDTANFTDEAEYDKLMAEAQNIAMEVDPPAIFYGELQWTVVLRSNIVGFDWNPIYLSAYPFGQMSRTS